MDIADACARAVSPVTITEEAAARALAYRRLVESMARGEFERNGRSWVLLLLPKLVASVPPHRLTHEYFRAMVDAYGVADFTSNSRLTRESSRFCWLPSDLCRKWFARHLLAWPDEFNPQDQTLDARPGSRENNPIEISSAPSTGCCSARKGGAWAQTWLRRIQMTTEPCERCCGFLQSTKRRQSMRLRAGLSQTEA